MTAFAIVLLAAPIAAMLPFLLALGATPAVAAALAIGAGLGASSIGFFVSMLAGSFVVIPAFDGALALAGLTVAARLGIARVPREPWRREQIAGFAVLAVAATAAAVAFFTNASLRPHGEWDAWAIWNLRARFLARAGSAWQAAFSRDLSWSHPDYPLLLPASIARIWAYLGATPTSVPTAIALLVAAATVVLLYAVLRELRGRSIAILAALALLGTPLFLQQSSWQYADVPLGFFFLAAIALLAESDAFPERRGLAILAGVATGLAAWTKNEGMLFAAVVLAVRGIGALRAGAYERNSFLRLLLGLAPAAAVLAAFQLLVAPPGDRFDEPWNVVWSRLTNIDRNVGVVARLAVEATGVASWLGAALAVYLLLLGRAPAAERRGSRTAARIVLIVLAGYALAYVVTSDDIAWQLRQSAARLLLQLWPASLFAFFAAAADPFERSAAPSRAAPKPVNRRSGAASSRRSA